MSKLRRIINQGSPFTENVIKFLESEGFKFTHSLSYVFRDGNTDIKVEIIVNKVNKSGTICVRFMNKDDLLPYESYTETFRTEQEFFKEYSYILELTREEFSYLEDN